NGLTVLMNRDPSVSGVVVDASFYAGALYEPPGKSGLAHLVEHLSYTGRAPDTDYQSLLESRGARDFNAFTTIDLMTFRVVVSPEDLPLALWVTEDRLGALPARLDEGELERARRIIVEERAVRIEDAPYGAADVELYRQLYPKPHPLHGTTIGVPEELAKLTISDARAYIARFLVPANGVLTLVGNFDPTIARAWLLKTVARLPPGSRAEVPARLPFPFGNVNTSVPERVARRPRVSLVWSFGELPRDTADALEFGALLLTLYLDGVFGLDMTTGLSEHAGGATFRLDVTPSRMETKQNTQANAEALLRYLTHTTMPEELLDATFLALDRITLTQLDSATTRASLLTYLECMVKDPARIARFNGRHWALSTFELQALTKKALSGERVTVHARPTRPLPPRKEREVSEP
ncbi:MAG: M16 family metallopeptidase, partial [Myxococcaceae bacterium]